MRSKSLFLMLLCQSNMHLSNSFLFPISRIILCKPSQACGIPFRCCSSVPVLCCFGVVIKDSQLLLQLGSFAEGVQVRGPTRGVARGDLIIWTSFDHLSFCPGDCAISFQCFSSLCLASLCWNLADPHCEYTIRLQSFQALNTDAKHIDKHLKTAKSCQVLRWHHSQKTWEIPLSKGSWGCWDIVPWRVSLRMQHEAAPNLLYIPSCKIRRPSLYEADPSLNQRFLGMGNGFGHVFQDAVAKISQISSWQGQSADCKDPCWSEKVIWSSQHPSGPCWKALHQKSPRQNMVSLVMQIDAVGLWSSQFDDCHRALRSGVGHGHRLDRIFPNLLCSMEDLQRQATFARYEKIDSVSPVSSVKRWPLKIWRILQTTYK